MADRDRDRKKGRKPLRPSKSKHCYFCKEKQHELDYKDIARLRKLTNEKGKILPRRTTGTCAKHQRLVTATVKRARMIALMPFVGE